VAVEASILVGLGNGDTGGLRLRNTHQTEYAAELKPALAAQKRGEKRKKKKAAG
jgi:hypothetical protein